MTTNLTPQQVLLAATDLMEKRGKATGTFWDEQGCCCVLGALYMAAHRAAQLDLYEPAKRVLRACIGRGSIACWSDANDAATVISALRKAGGA